MSYLRAGIAVVVAFVVQTVALPLVPIGGMTPDFLLATAAAVALLSGPGPAIGFGAAAGLLQDSFSGGLMGMNGFSKPLVVFVVARARLRPPLDSGLGVPVLLLFAAIADLLILWVLGEVAGFTPIPVREFGAAGLGIPVTLTYGVLVFRSLRPNRPEYEVA